jgi:serine/threonine protein kinase
VCSLQASRHPWTHHRERRAHSVFICPSSWQISDFGLAKWLPSEWTHRAIAPIEGTFGCLAPEYYTHGIVDEKTDVFAFGVLLLELVAGRKPVDGSHRSLLSWVINTDKQTFPSFHHCCT